MSNTPPEHPSLRSAPFPIVWHSSCRRLTASRYSLLHDRGRRGPRVVVVAGSARIYGIRGSAHPDRRRCPARVGAAGKIGIEKALPHATHYEALLSRFPTPKSRTQITSSTHVRGGQRRPRKIAWLGQIVYWTDEAVATAFTEAHAGDTTRRSRIDDCRNDAARRHSLLHLVLGTGANLSNPHALPDASTIPCQAACCALTSAWSGATTCRTLRRTAFIAPSPAGSQRYHTLEEIHQSVIAAMRPGVRACDLYKRCHGLCPTSLDPHAARRAFNRRLGSRAADAASLRPDRSSKQAW